VHATSALWPWRWRLVRPGLVLRAQHWGALCLIAPAAAVIGAAHFVYQMRPRVRAALMYDASLSYPVVEGVAVPNSLAALYPWIFLLSLAVVEVGLFWRRHSVNTAAAAVLHFGVSCFTNFLPTLAIAEVGWLLSARWGWVVAAW